MLAAADGATFRLRYDIRSTPAAQLWAQCLDQAKTSGLSEPQRFLNFPEKSEGSIADLLQQLTHTINLLKGLHPELDFPSLDANDLPKTINHLHQHFAHGHLVTNLVRDNNREAWSKFNILLHSIESALGIAETKAHTGGLTNATIVFTWKDSAKAPIPEGSYSEFVLDQVFGVAYANYSEVGRHILEIFNAGDDGLPDEHIRPSRLLSGDTRLFFGPTRGDYLTHSLNQRIEKWFRARAERFDRLGLHWGDPRLALGMIPVARLREQISTKTEILELVRLVSRHNRVESAAVK